MPPVFTTSQVAGFTLRPETPADLPFARELFATTRPLERQMWQNGEDAWLTFMAQQLDAQEKHYRAHFPDVTIDILERDGRDVGRLCLCLLPGEVRVMDIALIPEIRDQGLGSALLRAIMDEAARRGLAVRLHVESFNRAYGLYQRLGFRQLEDKGVYQFLEWRFGYAPRAAAS